MIDENQQIYVEGDEFYGDVMGENTVEVKAAYAIKAWGERAERCIEEFCGGTIEMLGGDSRIDGEGRLDPPESDDEILDFIFCSNSWLFCYSQEDLSDPLFLHIWTAEADEISCVVRNFGHAEHVVREFLKDLDMEFMEDLDQVFNQPKERDYFTGSEYSPIKGEIGRWPRNPWNDVDEELILLAKRKGEDYAIRIFLRLTNHFLSDDLEKAKKQRVTGRAYQW